MAFVIADRVKETTTTTGTGAVTLLGASTGFQSFAVIGNTNTTYYAIAAQSGNEWEVGIGTYSTTGPTLTRTTVLSNSSATQPSALNFSAGTKDIFVTYPSGRAIYGNITGSITPLDNAITRFDTTAGNIIQTSLVTVADDGAITAPQVGSIIPFYFANQAAFPSASTYHGAIAHSHADGAMYFAHGGVWTRILNDSGPLGTPSSGTLTNCTFPTLNQNTTGSAATLTTGRTIAITGDLAYTSPSFDGSGNVTAAGTLATVNSNVGSFNNASVTVNAKGLITAVSTGTGGAAVSNDTSTASNLFPLFASATTGTPSTIFTSNAKYLYKPSTGELKVDVPVAGNGIMVNSTTVATSYTIASGTNGFSVGPITVASGQAVSISAGQRWLIL